MKSASDKTLKPIRKVQIVKKLLFALPLLSLQVNTQANHGTASAIATATIISDIVGADEFESMSFTGIKDTVNNGSMVNQGRASFDLIGDNYTYGLTLPGEKIVLTKNGSPSTLRVGHSR